MWRNQFSIAFYHYFYIKLFGITDVANHQINATWRSPIEVKILMGELFLYINTYKYTSPASCIDVKLVELQTSLVQLVGLQTE